MRFLSCLVFFLLYQVSLISIVIINVKILILTLDVLFVWRLDRLGRYSCRTYSANAQKFDRDGRNPFKKKQV